MGAGGGAGAGAVADAVAAEVLGAAAAAAGARAPVPKVGAAPPKGLAVIAAPAAPGAACCAPKGALLPKGADVDAVPKAPAVGAAVIPPILPNPPPKVAAVAPPKGVAPMEVAAGAACENGLRVGADPKGLLAEVLAPEPPQPVLGRPAPCAAGADAGFLSMVACCCARVLRRCSMFADGRGGASQNW